MSLMGALDSVTSKVRDLVSDSIGVFVKLRNTIAGEDTTNNQLVTRHEWDGVNLFGDSFDVGGGELEGVIKGSPGVLGRVQVQAADAGKTLYIWDALATPVAGVDPLLAVIPLGTAGTVYEFDAKALVGLYGVWSAGTAAATSVWVGYL